MVQLLLPLLGGLASVATVGGAPPRYILFARPPGSAFNQNNPGTLSPTFLAKPLVGIGAAASPQHDLLIGSEVIFSLMQSPEPVLLASLNAVLNASVASGVPISLVSALALPGGLLGLAHTHTAKPRCDLVGGAVRALADKTAGA